MGASSHGGGDGPRELGRTREHEGRFLAFETIRWRDGGGRERRWESAERLGTGRAVLTVPRLRPSNRLVLIRQYRPPARREVLEFPAGLLDEGEEEAACALRELAEETGYRGTVRALWPPAFNSPGLSGETVAVAVVEIDETLPENAAPVPRTEPGEEIETVLVPEAELGETLRREAARGVGIDSKVLAYALGGGWDEPAN